MIKKFILSLCVILLLAATTGCAVDTYQPAQAAVSEETVVDAVQPVLNAAPPTGNNADASLQGSGQGWQSQPESNTLSEAEAASLLFMFEEEKLAHDVYRQLYDLWGSAVFQNISSSETAHMNAVGQLLERYGLTAPDASQVGVFSNPELQALYSELVARGSQSLVEALKVGGAIEELDILDLQELMTQTGNTAILRVYDNLLRGSGNHLSAFANALTNQTGESYQPQYLSLESYQAIVSGTSQGQSQAGRGRQGTQSSAGGRGGQGGQGYRGGQAGNP